MHHHHHLLIAALITITLVAALIVTKPGSHHPNAYPPFVSQGNGPVVFTVNVKKYNPSQR